MNRHFVGLLITLVAFAQYVPEKHHLTETCSTPRQGTLLSDRIFIDSVGDIRAILGPQGKNIIVCKHGDNIAVIYGAPTGDPNNSMQAQVAISANAGMSWTIYGPFSGALRRLYAGVDGPPNFCQIGGLVFVWQENTIGYNDGQIVVMLLENVPSSPSFSVPSILPNSQPPAMYPWEPSVAVAPDNPDYVVLTAWSFLANGNEWAYCWISTDGGYTWTDALPMAHITQDGACGHIRQGTDGYVFYTYQDYYNFTPTDSTPYPYYLESTDGGYTWGPETPIPGVPVNSGSQFWWHELDCEVVNNEPWAIHTDIGSPGGGPYIMHGVGSPGNWTWEIWDAGQLGTCSLTVADTTFYCHPSQYPNLSYDPVSNTILASYKAYYYKEYAGTIYYDGVHIGGIYTTNNGASWIISQPLSDTTQIAWPDWNATEIAHRLVYINGNVYSYAVWLDEVALLLYFERGLVKSFLPTGIEENNSDNAKHISFTIAPTIVSDACYIRLSAPVVCDVIISIYDCTGRKVTGLPRSNLESGNHVIRIPTSELPKGIYFVNITTGGTKQLKKFVVVN